MMICWELPLHPYSQTLMPLPKCQILNIPLVTELTQAVSHITVLIRKIGTKVLDLADKVLCLTQAKNAGAGVVDHIYFPDFTVFLWYFLGTLSVT